MSYEIIDFKPDYSSGMLVCSYIRSDDGSAVIDSRYSDPLVGWVLLRDFRNIEPNVVLPVSSDEIGRQLWKGYWEDAMANAYREVLTLEQMAPWNGDLQDSDEIIRTDARK